MKRKVQETFDVETTRSTNKKQRTTVNSTEEEDLHWYSLLDPMPVASSVPLYFAESRYSPAFRTFQSFYNNSDLHFDTEFYFVQQQNYDDCSFESSRYSAEPYFINYSIERYSRVPEYSTGTGRIPSLQNQADTHRGDAVKRVEEKESYRSSVVSSPEPDDDYQPLTHGITSDTSTLQKKPLSKVPDPNIIKQMRDLIDSQKIFQKDISAKLGVRYVFLVVLHRVDK